MAITPGRDRRYIYRLILKAEKTYPSIPYEGLAKLNECRSN